MSEPWLKYEAKGGAAAAEAGPWAKYADKPADGGLHPDLPDSYDKALEAARKSTKGDIFEPIYSGATLGFGKDVDVLGSEAVTGLQNMVHRLRKEAIPYSAEEAGRATRQAETENEQQMEAEHPIVKGAMELGGALLTPGVGLAGKGLKALGMTSPVARAMTLGAGLGGASAVGQSEGSIPERLSAAPGGALAGGLTAGALHGAGRATGALGRLLGPGATEAAARIKERVSGVPVGEVTPRMQAQAKEVGPAIARRMADKLDTFGDKLSKDHPAEKAGMDITAAEAMGPQAVGKLAAYGRLSGQTPDALWNRMWDRILETPDQIVGDFAKVTGVDPEAAVGNIDKLSQSLQTKAGPAYDAFYASGPIDSPEIRSILETDAGKKALARAYTRASNRRINPFDIGLEKNEVPVVMDGKPLLRADGSPVMMPGEGIKVKVPTPMALDFTRQALDDMIEGYRNKQTGKLELDGEGRDILQVRNDLQAELKREDAPWGKLYRTATDAGGEPIRIRQAFYDDAKKALSSTSQGWQFDKLMERYAAQKGGQPPAAKEALRSGVVNQIKEWADAADVTRLKKLLRPNMQKRLETIFGKEQADEVGALLKHRIMLLETAKQLLPTAGSRTSRDLAAMDEDRRDQEHAMRTAAMALSGHPRRALTSAIHYVLSGAWDRAQAGADEATRDIVGAMLMQSPSEFTDTLERHAVSKAQAQKVLKKLEDVGWFAPRLGGAAGGAMKKSGVSAWVEGRPETYTEGYVPVGGENAVDTEGRQ